MNKSYTAHATFASQCTNMKSEHHDRLL